MTYPLGIAIKNGGGRKTKENRHIRSERGKRRAFLSEASKIRAAYERKTGIKVPDDLTDEELDARSLRDPDFAAMRKKVYNLREYWLGY